MCNRSSSTGGCVTTSHTLSSALLLKTTIDKLHFRTNANRLISGNSTVDEEPWAGFDFPSNRFPCPPKALKQLKTCMQHYSWSWDAWKTRQQYAIFQIFPYQFYSRLQTARNPSLTIQYKNTTTSTTSPHEDSCSDIRTAPTKLWATHRM